MLKIQIQKLGKFCVWSSVRADYPPPFFPYFIGVSAVFAYLLLSLSAKVKLNFPFLKTLQTDVFWLNSDFLTVITIGNLFVIPNYLFYRNLENRSEFSNFLCVKNPDKTSNFPYIFSKINLHKPFSALKIPFIL